MAGLPDDLQVRKSFAVSCAWIHTNKAVHTLMCQYVTNERIG